MLFGAEGVGHGEELALRQGGQKEAQHLQENLGRSSTLLHQLGGKHEILRRRNRNNLSLLTRGGDVRTRAGLKPM